MSSRRRLGFLAIVPVVLLNLTVAACGNDAATRTSTAGIDDSDTVDPVGRTFVSTEVRGHDLVEGTSVNLSFEPDQVSVSAACNTFTGPASRNDGTLAINADSLGRDDDGLRARIAVAGRLADRLPTSSPAPQARRVHVDHWRYESRE